MTREELLAERAEVDFMALLDQISFGSSCTKTWIDAQGNERSKHVPISEVYFARGTEK